MDDITAVACNTKVQQLASCCAASACNHMRLNYELKKSAGGELQFQRARIATERMADHFAVKKHSSIRHSLVQLSRDE
jgi:hypothetical protein